MPGTIRRQSNPNFLPTPNHTLVKPTFPHAPTQAQVRHPPPNPTVTSNTLTGVVATSPNLSISGFPWVFTLLEDGENTTSQARLERLETLTLGDRPPLVVCLEAPDPHTRVI